MTVLARKGPSGPLFLPLSLQHPGGTLRESLVGADIEAVAGTHTGQLWFWDGQRSRFSNGFPSDGQSPLWDAASNDWTYGSPSTGDFLDYSFTVPLVTLAALEFDLEGPFSAPGLFQADNPTFMFGTNNANRRIRPVGVEFAADQSINILLFNFGDEFADFDAQVYLTARKTA